MSGDADTSEHARKICVVTIHGIGFQRPPSDGLPGYADELHENLAAELGGKLSGEPVYVTSAKPGTRDREWGLGRLGTWRETRDDRGSREIDISRVPLTDGDQPVAHVALCYTPLEGTRAGFSTSAGAIAEAGLRLGDYTSLSHAVGRLVGDAWTALHHAGAIEADQKHQGTMLRPRDHDAGTMGVVATLEDDVVAYVCRNDVREEIREFAAEALRRLMARPDVAGVVINAHSQGTVLAFDVLRADPAGAAACARALVTAGSPLRKYASLFSWGGDAGAIRDVTWLNFWDEKDPVADPLDPPESWRLGDNAARQDGELGLFWAVKDDGTQVPVPITDHRVDNVANSSPAGLRAHNYWGNTAEFIPALARLLEAELPALPCIPMDSITDAAGILGLLRLERLEVDMFRSGRLPGERRRLYGGQVAAQALAAAGYTAEETRPHSLHAYFLRPGDTSVPVVFQVERLHDGRTFRRRRVTAIQHGQAILCLESSFTADTTNAGDYRPAPPLPGPEDCEDYDAAWHLGRDGGVSPWRLFDAKAISPKRAGEIPPEVRLTTRDFWFRARPAALEAAEGIMPEAIVAYLSDLTLSSAALRPTPGHPAGRTDVTGLTSLDHSVWFHNAPDLSDWLLFAKTSPASGPMRGLTAGQFFTRDGVLIATVAQECLTHTRGAGQS